MGISERQIELQGETEYLFASRRTAKVIFQNGQMPLASTSRLRGQLERFFDFQGDTWPSWLYSSKAVQCREVDSSPQQIVA
jgi:hypothetical protein